MAANADVIIAGAGPAGSLAAYELARHNVSVLILEKSIFPRYKVCGGGLTYKILAQIPFDLSPVLETQVYNVIFSYGFREVFTRSSEEPVLFCTNRDKLDQFLLQKAVEAGAQVLHGVKVTQIIQDKDFVKVVTPGGNYSSRLLVGADGASSAVARSAGLRENILPGLAWEAEVRFEPAVMNSLKQSVFLDWGTFPGGYGWVFPKGDHFSIGVGGPANLSKWMMPYYDKFLAYLAAGEWSNITDSKCKMQNAKCKMEVIETISLKSWPIPVRIKKSRFHNGRVLVAGDAAGLTDPLTGEGIYYAVRSGILAAGHSLDYLQKGTGSLEPYTKAVNDELMGELLEANRIKHLFNTVPGKIHHFVRDSDRAWRAFAKILRGERSYADVPGGFGRWKRMWGTACFIAKLNSALNEKRFSKNGFK